MNKKIISILLTASMMASFVPFSAFAEGTEELSPPPTQEEEVFEVPAEDNVTEAPLPTAGITEPDSDEAVKPDEAAQPDEAPEAAEEPLPSEEPQEEAVEAQYVRVEFSCDPEGLTLTVWEHSAGEAETEDDPAMPIAPEADGSYLLLPGEYIYKAVCEGFEAEEELFVVDSEPLTLTVALSGKTAADDDRLPLMRTAGRCGDDLIWSFSDGVLTISGTGELYDYSMPKMAPWIDLFSGNLVTSIVIEPGVTGITDYAFLDCWGATSLTIGNDVTSIGTCAFWRCDFQEVTIGSSVLTIGEGAFRECEYLQSITIPDSVTGIGSEAFQGCISLKSAVIGNGVENIGSRAFYNCQSLRSLTIGSNVTNIGSKVFSGCTALTSPVIPETLTSVGRDMFSGCTGLTSVTIPANIRYIEDSAFSGCTGLTSLVIPETVETVGNDAFYGCTGLTSVTMPGSLCIERTSFSGCNALWSFTLTGDTADRSAGEVLFYHAKEIILADGMCSIGWSAFSGCSLLEHITIPDTVTSIGDYAFYECDGLASVSIPDSVTSIGINAFCHCNQLTAVTVPDSVTSIGDRAFASCSKLTAINVDINNNYYCSENGVLYNKGKTALIQVPCAFPGPFVMPGTVTDVTDYAFENCTGIADRNGFVIIGNVLYDYFGTAANITIPSGVTTISGNSFAYQYGLQSVTIPDSVVSIGEYAFRNCRDLTNLTIGSAVKDIGDGAFYDCYSLYNVKIKSVSAWCAIDFASRESNPLYHAPELFLNGRKVTDLVIPEGVTSISEQAFFCCTGIRSVTIPETLTRVGRSAFGGCENLEAVYINNISAWCAVKFYDKSGNPLSCAGNLYLNGTPVTALTVPDGVTDIGDYAFCNCDSLTELIVPAGITDIGESAFNDCDGLTEITVPASVSRIGTDAFSGCGNITTVNITDLEAWCNISFGSHSSNPLCCDKSGLYLNGTPVTEVSFPEGTTDVGDYVFCNLSTLTRAEIPASVTYIGDGAFYGCSSLVSADIPEGVTSIGESAFDNCTVLENITIPEGVTYIGDRAFFACYGLTKAEIPEGVTEIGNEVFCNNFNLEELTLGSNITSIGNRAFYDCSKLTSLELPDSLKTIGSYAFSGCHFTELIIPEGTKFIGKWAFAGCWMETLTIPDSVTTIWEGAFEGCSSLTEVILGDGLTALNKGVFANCTALKDVTFGSDLTEIGEEAFNNCQQLAEIAIPEGVTSIGRRAFYDCKSLSNVTIPASLGYFGLYAFGNGAAKTDVYISDLTAWCSIQFANTEYYCAANPLSGTLYLNSVPVTDLVIPDGVTFIRNNAFQACDSLTSVTLPDGVTDIGREAFISCKNLRSVTIPVSVEKIGKLAFSDTTDLHVYYNGSESQWKNVAIYGEDRGLDNATVHYILPDPREDDLTWSIDAAGTLRIGGSGAMNDYKSPNYHAPWYPDRSQIKSVVIEDGVTSIGSQAFCDCTELTEAVISGSVSVIGSGAFLNCSSLTEVSIPVGVKYIMTDAFKDCTALLKTAYSGSVEQWLKISVSKGNDNLTKSLTIGGQLCLAFGNCGDSAEWCLFKDGTLIISGIGEMEPVSWTTTQPMPWRTHNKEIVNAIIQPGITTVGYQAFEGCSNLVSVTIPDGVKSIDRSAFDGCSILTDVEIPGSVKEIQKNAFLSCYDLRSVALHNGLTSIGEKAFQYCGSLESISIPGSVISIGSNAFSGCTSLTSVSLPDSVTSIGDSAFSDCSSLTSVSLPGSVTSIGNHAFSRCTSLTSVILPDSVTSIGDSSFSDCSSLSSFEIPGNVTSIGAYAFESCSSLTDLAIPEHVTEIKYGAFYGCTGITDMTIPAGITELDHILFSHCSSLRKIVLPESIEKIYSGAFSGCTSLTEVWYGGTAKQWGKIPVSGDNDCLKNASIVYGYKPFYDVRYDLNGGESGPEARRKPYGETVPLSDAVPEWDGYLFLGWATAKKSTRPEYQPGDSYEANADLTLYAIWLPWGDVGYIWSDDHTVCTAKRALKSDPTQVETAVAHITVDEQPASCATVGRRITTARFAEKWAHEQIYIELLPATKHDWVTGDAVWDGVSSCTVTRTCRTDPTHTETAEASVTARITKAATCVENGAMSYTAYFAENWAAVQTKTEPIPATGHSFGTDVIYDWTNEGCTARRSCMLCRHETETVSAVVTSSVVEASCVKAGSTTFTATFAADWAQTQSRTLIIPATGVHRVNIEEAKPATCTEAGYTVLEKCADCGKILAEKQVVPATGHTWEWNESENCFICVHDCGETREHAVVVISSPEGSHDSVGSGKSIKLTGSMADGGELPPLTWKLAEDSKQFASLKPARDGMSATLTAAAGLTEDHIVTVLAECTSDALTPSFEKQIKVYPSVTMLNISHDGENVTGKSMTVDLNSVTKLRFETFTAPDNTDSRIVWSRSDDKSFSHTGSSVEIELDPAAAKLSTVTLTARDTVSQKSANVKIITTRLSTGVILDDPLMGETIESGNSAKFTAAVLGNPKDKGIVWSIPPEYQAFASVSNGTLKVNELTEPHQIVLTAAAKDDGSEASTLVNLVPKSGSVALRVDGKPVVNGTETLYVNDIENEDIQVWAEILPTGAKQRVKWTGFEKSGTIATFRPDTDDPNILHISEFTGKTGTVTLTAQAADKGAKKAAVKLVIAKYAQDIEILDSKGRSIVEPITVKGKSSYSFKDSVSSSKDKTISDKTVIWSVDRPDAATITKGKLTSRSFAGDPVEVVVTAALAANPDVFSSTVVTITPDLGKCVNIYNEDGKLLNGLTEPLSIHAGSVKLSAELIGLDGPVTWTSSNMTAFPITQDGVMSINPLSAKAGAVTISAAASDKKTKASFKFNVTVPVEELVLTSKTSSYSVTGGKSLTLTATVSAKLPAGAHTPLKPTNTKVIWSLEGEGAAYAKISSSGVLTAEKVSEVHELTVRAVSQENASVYAERCIRIYPAASSLTIDASGIPGVIEISGEQRTYRLGAVVNPMGAMENVQWTCSNKAITFSPAVGGSTTMTVPANIKAGVLTITATSVDGTNKKATLRLNAAMLVSSITFDREVYEVVGGKSITLVPAVSDATNRKLNWSINDTRYASISNGKLTAKKVTGMKKVLVTAAAADGSGIFAVCEVIINP